MISHISNFWLLGKSLIDDLLDPLQISKNAAKLSFNSKESCKENIFLRRKMVAALFLFPLRTSRIISLLCCCRWITADIWAASTIMSNALCLLRPFHTFLDASPSAEIGPSGTRTYYWATLCSNSARNSMKFYGRLTFITLFLLYLCNNHSAVNKLS